jgi:hypothetical protein
MPNQSVTQDDAQPAGIRERALNWRVRLGKFARIVQQISRFFAKDTHFFAYVDGPPIGRIEATKHYVATVHELAALDAAARAQLSGEIHDAFIASFQQCCEHVGRGPSRLSTTASWRRLLECTPGQRADVAVHAYARFRAITSCPVYMSFDWRPPNAANEIFVTLMRSNLPFSQKQLVKLLVLMTDQRQSYNSTARHRSEPFFVRSNARRPSKISTAGSRNMSAASLITARNWASKTRILNTTRITALFGSVSKPFWPTGTSRSLCRIRPGRFTSRTRLPASRQSCKPGST